MPHSFISALESQMLHYLPPSKLASTSSPPPIEILLWIVLSGLDSSTFDDRDMGWRVARLMHAAKMVSPERRQQFRDWMLKFLIGSLPEAHSVGTTCLETFDVEEVRSEILERKGDS